MSAAKKRRVPKKNAILFRFHGKKPSRAALKKMVSPPGSPVVYFAMQKPLYFRWRERPGRWHHLSTRPTYKAGDEVIFAFRDTSPGKSALDAVGVAVDFAQAIAPFDDEVTAEIRMAAAERYSFVTREATWETFALGWDLSEGNVEGELQGFRFESRGRYEYTVSLVTFGTTKLNRSFSFRYWQDPEMDIGN